MKKKERKGKFEQIKYFLINMIEITILVGIFAILSIGILELLASVI